MVRGRSLLDVPAQGRRDRKGHAGRGRVFRGQVRVRARGKGVGSGGAGAHGSSVQQIDCHVVTFTFSLQPLWR